MNSWNKVSGRGHWDESAQMPEEQPSLSISNNFSPAPSEEYSHERVIVMARCPEAGRVKTRLIPALGPEDASVLHARLVQFTLNTVRDFADQHGCSIDVQYAGGSADEMGRRFGSEFSYSSQQGESLGDRISFAVQKAFAEGCGRVIVVGTDCPLLRSSHLQQAFDSLQGVEVVIGPAFDGGYYLIGMTCHLPSLFEGINWGSATVFKETQSVVREQNNSLALLSPLSDIDLPEDLVLCRKFPDLFSPPLPRGEPGLISVVIPTLNEEANLPRLLEQLSCESGIEVIVADGGSSDATVEIAQQANIRVIRCGPGRGRQLNAGAAMSNGQVLFFIHADVQLPAGFAETVWSVLKRGCVLGAFRLKIDDPRWRFRIVEFATNLRSQLFRLPYGDQGLFTTSELFFGLDGFKNWPLMEDFEFVKRIQRVGKLYVASSCISVSARRWKKLGVLKTTLINQFIVVAYKLGVSPAKLADYYRSAKKTSG